ncbi:hypothetical protein [Microlunatus ginsengisoli]|uniref:Uncharacterized protein n=1 Tax=Microlunatus ginsengisoli TaxID=363863 RepID=A0ABP7ACE6_9ACTN
MTPEADPGAASPGAAVWRFDGQIAGLGTSAGPRIVVGRWFDSPLGSFADVMLEEPAGRRILMAPSPDVADFVAGTYRFDEVVVGPVTVSEQTSVRGAQRALRIEAPGLSLRISIGRRAALGVLLRLQPRRLVGSPRWASLLDPVARRVLPGVRTRGSAGGGRQEFYGASDLHRLVSAEGRWRGTDLGRLGPVDPPVTFGFGSAPRRPSLTRIVTTVIAGSE